MWIHSNILEKQIANAPTCQRIRIEFFNAYNVKRS